jgi:hypothetical protein
VGEALEDPFAGDAGALTQDAAGEDGGAELPGRGAALEGAEDGGGLGEQAALPGRRGCCRRRCRGRRW